ncbi:acyl-CoA thioesterase [Camelimonas sp. ID_303_24]
MAEQPAARRPARPQRAAFPHFTPIQTRWLDNDVYGHVNNSVYGHYVDTAINDWLIGNGIVDLHGAVGLIGLVVETRCVFFDSVAFPDRLEAGLRIAALGNSSVTFEVGIFRHGEAQASALGVCVHVYVDRATRRPTPLPEAERARFATLLAAPEG